MPNLIAIGYNDTSTGPQAMDEVTQLAKDLVIQPDAVAAIVRDQDGKYRTITNQHEVGAGTSWGMLWGLLFGALFFVPVLGMAVGAGMGALMGKIAKTGIDQQFQDQVRAALQPGTSALFMIVEQMTSDKALEALSKYGGTVIKTSLSKEQEAQLQQELSGKEMAGVR